MKDLKTTLYKNITGSEFITVELFNDLPVKIEFCYHAPVREANDCPGVPEYIEYINMTIPSAYKYLCEIDDDETSLSIPDKIQDVILAKYERKIEDAIFAWRDQDKYEREIDKAEYDNDMIQETLNRR